MRDSIDNYALSLSLSLSLYLREKSNYLMKRRRVFIFNGYPKPPGNPILEHTLVLLTSPHLTHNNNNKTLPTYPFHL